MNDTDGRGTSERPSEPSRATSFDLLGDLPAPGSTTVLEASAGTGKTYALAGLVTRYLADGHATLDQMLLITFGRAASQELRARVREQLVRAARALDEPGAGTTGPAGAADDLLCWLVDAPEDVLAARRHCLRDALADFDAATIATTHQFCRLVLASLGVAGDSDAGVTLVESLDELTGEVVDDLYLRRFGHLPDPPPMTRAEALTLAREVIGNPHTTLTPEDPEPGSRAQTRVEFARDVLVELEHRKRRLGILGYDDLLTRLAAAVSDADAPARQRMRQRWQIVMVDEFQDTDPVQWEVIRGAFLREPSRGSVERGTSERSSGPSTTVGDATVILIGDPKQAIYAFRGGDIDTYLQARTTADLVATLDTNRRSDEPLVQSLQAVMRGAALGHDEIVVRPVQTAHRQHRLSGAPHNEPFRLRVVTREKFGVRGTKTIGMDRVRDHVARDAALDIADLLASRAMFGDRPLVASDVAIIVEAHRDARACREALREVGIPAVYTGDTDVFASAAAADWLRLLEAFEQPHRSGLVRAAAATMFFGETALSLAEGGYELTGQIAQTVREWADHARERGLAAVYEAAQVAGLGSRVLGWHGGERQLTDLAHIGQLLHETAHRERLGLPAVLDWLRTQCSGATRGAERNRRLDSDADAVQIMTVWVSKGLQYPVVYLPFAFNRHHPDRDNLLFHRDGRRCLDIGGRRSGYPAVAALARREVAGDDIRLTYVALTRAQSQVVAWWAPTWDEPNGGLSRLLRGREPGAAAVPDRCPDVPDDRGAIALFRGWQTAGGPIVEQSRLAEPVPLSLSELPDGIGVRTFDRRLDTAWRRTSYSGLIRAAAEAGETAGTASEPEVQPRDDETLEVPTGQLDPAVDGSGDDSAESVVSPMSDLPSSATFGSLVHGVLEEADLAAPDLLAELRSRVVEQLRWWPVDASADDIAEALVPLHHSPLGPLAPGLTLADIGGRDRLCELDFEIPLAGGDQQPGQQSNRAGEVRLVDVGRLLREHLSEDDALLPYADRLEAAGLGDQSLRGYLSGSIDVILRIPADDTGGEDGPDSQGHRYLVADYKTNHLGGSTERGATGPGAADRRPLTAADYSRDRLDEAMLHSDYPLQALLYTVVAHRYLRWRQPGYDPAQHLAGVLYLYVRGMCGLQTPIVDGHPAGVFSWSPPAALVVALSDLLDGSRRGSTTGSGRGSTTGSGRGSTTGSGRGSTTGSGPGSTTGSGRGSTTGGS